MDNLYSEHKIVGERASYWRVKKARTDVMFANSNNQRQGRNPLLCPGFIFEEISQNVISGCYCWQCKYMGKMEG